MGKGKTSDATMKRRDPGTGGWTNDLLEQEAAGVPRLGFTPSLERQFRRFLLEQTVSQARMALFISVVVFLLFGGLDLLLFPVQAGTIWRLRYLGVGPLLVLLLAASFWRLGERIFPVLITLMVWLVGLGLVGFMAITSRHDPQLYYGGFMLTTVVAYVFFGLRLPQAALAGWGLLMVYLAGDRLLVGSERVYFLHNVLGLAATNLMGMVAAYIIERQHRKVFLQSLLIEREKQQLERANARLKELSYEDGLTGIANRRHFDERFHEEWVRALRHRYPITLLMIDVDHFKAYNDREGHQAGDRCLRVLGALLRGFTKRPGDLAARYGGEEFVVILSGTAAAGGREMAENIRREVEFRAIPHPASPVSRVVTVSIGVATAIPGPGDSPEDLLAAADSALYTAKASGRNRVVLERGDQSGPPSSG